MSSLRIITALLMLILFSTSSAASSPLARLPFDIVIGETTNQELANRGICKKQIKIKNTHSFRCEIYEIQNGAVEVKSSQNQIAKEMWINRLPRSWTKLGLKEYKAHDTIFTSDELMTILKEQGVEDLENINPYIRKDRFGRPRKEIHWVDFYIDNHSYRILYEMEVDFGYEDNPFNPPEILRVNSGIKTILVLEAF